MTTALIGLGSNLGDRRLMLDFAIKRLRETSGVHHVVASSYHETKSIGGPANQPLFLNAAARVETSLEAEELFREMQRIEQEAGRLREMHWGPRTLDLDLLLFGLKVSGKRTLTLPHRLLRFRRFVLEPAAEIAGDMITPYSLLKISDLWRQLQILPPHYEIWCPIPGIGEEIRDRLLMLICQPETELFVWNEEPNSELIEKGDGKARFLCFPSDHWLTPNHPLNINDSARYSKIQSRLKYFRENIRFMHRTAFLSVAFEQIEDAIQEIASVIQSMR